MSIDIETLKRIGKEVSEPGSRRGTGKVSGEKKEKLPKAEKCPSHGSEYCKNTCNGHSNCQRDSYKTKLAAGYTLIKPWMGIATMHPDWVGKWKKL